MTGWKRVIEAASLEATLPERKALYAGGIHYEIRRLWKRGIGMRVWVMVPRQLYANAQRILEERDKT